MISVFDMKTATYTDYTLSPVEAVIAAYAQRERRDWSTWTYSQYRDKVTISESNVVDGLVIVTCGNQTCISKKGLEYISPVASDCVGSGFVEVP